MAGCQKQGYRAMSLSAPRCTSPMTATEHLGQALGGVGRRENRMGTSADAPSHDRSCTQATWHRRLGKFSILSGPHSLIVDGSEDGLAPSPAILEIIAHLTHHGCL